MQMSSFVKQNKKRKDPGIREIVSVISSPQRTVKKDPPRNKRLKKNQDLFCAQARLDS